MNKGKVLTAFQEGMCPINKIFVGNTSVASMLSNKRRVGFDKHIGNVRFFHTIQLFFRASHERIPKKITFLASLQLEIYFLRDLS